MLNTISCSFSMHSTRQMDYLACRRQPVPLILIFPRHQILNSLGCRSHSLGALYVRAYPLIRTMNPALGSNSITQSPKGRWSISDSPFTLKQRMLHSLFLVARTDVSKRSSMTVNLNVTSLSITTLSLSDLKIISSAHS